MEALSVASKACGVQVAEMTAANRRRAQVAFARQMAMYLCHVVGKMSLRDVAIEFERDRTTVGHACHAIEDRRDCPVFDKQIDYLEKEMTHRIAMLVEQATAAPSAFFERKCYSLAG
jgi:chromosomal replication initiation ATPase DnaA